MRGKRKKTPGAGALAPQYKAYQADIDLELEEDELSSIILDEETLEDIPSLFNYGDPAVDEANGGMDDPTSPHFIPWAERVEPLPRPNKRVKMHRVATRLEPQLYACIRTLAAYNHRSVSAYMRMCLVKAVEHSGCFDYEIIESLWLDVAPDANKFYRENKEKFTQFVSDQKKKRS